MHALSTTTGAGASFANQISAESTSSIGSHSCGRPVPSNSAPLRNRTCDDRLDHRTGTVTTGKAADLTILGADL